MINVLFILWGFFSSFISKSWCHSNIRFGNLSSWRFLIKTSWIVFNTIPKMGYDNLVEGSLKITLCICLLANFSLKRSMLKISFNQKSFYSFKKLQTVIFSTVSSFVAFSCSKNLQYYCNTSKSARYFCKQISYTVTRTWMFCKMWLTNWKTFPRINVGNF